jgi:hypothetical protein
VCAALYKCGFTATLTGRSQEWKTKCDRALHYGDLGAWHLGQATATIYSFSTRISLKVGICTKPHGVTSQNSYYTKSCSDKCTLFIICYLIQFIYLFLFFIVIYLLGTPLTNKWWTRSSRYSDHKLNTVSDILSTNLYILMSTIHL